jgi:hypothetical protein
MLESAVGAIAGSRTNAKGPDRERPSPFCQQKRALNFRARGLSFLLSLLLSNRARISSRTWGFQQPGPIRFGFGSLVAKLATKVRVSVTAMAALSMSHHLSQGHAVRHCRSLKILGNYSQHGCDMASRL